MPLHAVVASWSAEIVGRWRHRISAAVVPAGVAPLELEDHIPEFLQQLAEAVRSVAPGPKESSEAEVASAAVHGTQRLRLGFSLGAVIREYGALCDTIVEVAHDKEEAISERELMTLFECINNGIANAVVAYTNHRDAELRRQGNEHFAFIAHELRNPLSSARLGLDVLRTHGQLPSNSRAVAVIDRAIQTMSDLIDRVLRNARVASGLTLHREPTTLRALFSDAESTATLEAEAKGIEVVQEIAADAEISVDVRLVGSALGNLVRNAVHHSRPDSCVILRGRVDGGRVQLEVEDRCGGLPEGKVEQAFAPFVRLEPEKDDAGFGLGLAIAKQAVDAHGGNIRVQNLPGTGCVFVLEFPVA